MNFIYKILLFSILSFAIPIGRIFEVFIWSNNIIKIENVVQTNELKLNGRFCSFNKVAKKNNEKIISKYQRKHFFILRVKIQNLKTRLSLITQNKQFKKFKPILICRFLFNVSYIDDSEPLLFS